MGGGRERIEAEGHGAVRGTYARAFNQRGKTERLAGTFAPKIELEMRLCVKRRPFESPVKRCWIESSKPKTVGAERAGEHDLQTVRAVGEVVERLSVGLVGVGMVEPGDNPPWSGASKRPRTLSRPIDGLDQDRRPPSWT